ncbi:MAG TPA: fused MFS/spermidine synthase [Chloroflexota bacterium]|nr:fused MFS/spermidine synthase [Chloroflexota bacterium]
MDRLWIGVTAATALGAFLLFLAQPLFARSALPAYGGGAVVWTAALVFSQVALVVGYAYAHLSGTLPPRTQVVLHLGLLWTLLAAPGIGVPSGYVPERTALLDFLLVATTRLGPRLVVIAGTGVLLQRWLAAARPAQAGASYALYAASSAGSLLGLLAFPFVLEPALQLADQERLWTALYAALALLATVCARGVLQVSADPEVVLVRSGGGAAAGAIAWPNARRAAAWMALAAAPCSAMVALTSVLTIDVAAVPLIWVAPLAVYLLTYVLAFAPGERKGLPPAIGALLVLPAVVATAGRLTSPLGLLLVVHLGALYAVALGCHARLAAARPSAERSSGFYLCVSVGGAVGGLLAGVAAPAVLNTLAEYPVALVGAWLLALRLPGRGERRAALRDVAWALGVGALAAALLGRAGDGWAITGVVGSGVLLAPPALACLTFARRPLRFGLAAGALLLVAHVAPAAGTALHAKRTPYGLHRVRVVQGDAPEERYHLLFHGTTMHGIQRWEGGESGIEPLSYYHRGSGIADLFRVWRAALGVGPGSGKVGVVGLGTGALACYGAPGERWTFFELDPEVARIARDNQLFTYLRDCPARSEVVVGDGRLGLAEVEDGSLGVLVMDAYSSDAPPVHLLTREALALYMRKLTPGGVVAFHISNRHLDLEPVLGALARELGWLCLVRSEEAPSAAADGAVTGAASSKWAVMGRLGAEGGALRRLAADRRWLAARTEPDIPAWSDGYAPVARIMRWG